MSFQQHAITMLTADLATARCTLPEVPGKGPRGLGHTRPCVWHMWNALLLKRLRCVPGQPQW